MAAAYNVKVLDVCRVGPPPGSVAATSLPLTFFDAMWLQIPPIQRLFFYQFPSDLVPGFTTTYFINSLLPNLKHSLSLSLQLFYPLAGNLIFSPTSGEQEIRYVDGDGVSVIISESDADFHRLAARGPRDATELFPLLPELLPVPDNQNQPLFAVRVTLFPESGICMGTSFHHVAADGRSYIHFVKSWASICRSSGNLLLMPAPFHDRSLLEHLDGLKSLILDQLQFIPNNVVLATFTMSREDIEKLRQRVLAQQADYGGKPLRCSAFAITCAYLWVCNVKSYTDSSMDKTVYFAFPVDCRARLPGPPLPSTYFGNCVSMRVISTKGSKLAAEDGIRHATEVIGGAVQALDSTGVLNDLEKWTPRTVALAGHEHRVLAVGSPKFQVYETDFGWGRPITSEFVSVARTCGVCLAESRDEEGGIEINVGLPKCQMEKFTLLFEEGLKHPSP